MVSDEEIVSVLETILGQIDFNVTTSLDIRLKLEEKLGVSLAEKRGLITNHLNLLLQSKRAMPLLHHQTQPSFHHHSATVSGGVLQFQGQKSVETVGAPPDLKGNFRVDVPQSPVVQIQESPKETSPSQQSNPPAGGKRKGGAGGLNKLCGVTPELQAIVGEPTMTRTQIVKELWAYIRKNNLQDPSNKRKIICNDALRIVFETDCTDMFKMNKLLAKHIFSLEPTKASVPDAKRLKPSYLDSSAQVGVGSLVIISDALSRFLGTGEREMLHAVVLERVWHYIQKNHLQDPNSMVTCDSRLREIFKCEKFPALGLSEMLSHHFLNR